MSNDVLPIIALYSQVTHIFMQFTGTRRTSLGSLFNPSIAHHGLCNHYLVCVIGSRIDSPNRVCTQGGPSTTNPAAQLHPLPQIHTHLTCTPPAAGTPSWTQVQGVGRTGQGRVGS